LRATRLLFQGQRERRAGRPAEAAETLGRAAAADPDSPHVALHRALAVADAGQLDEALRLLEDAGTRWPENPVFPLFRGGLLAENDRLDEAGPALAVARKLSPKNLLIEAYEALTALRRGSIEPPLRRLGVVGLTDNPRALAAILTEVEAELFRRFGSDTDASPPRVEELPQASPREAARSAPRLADAGVERLERGDPMGAVPLLALAAEKNPSLPDVYAYLGFAWFDLGHYEKALECLARVGTWSKVLDAAHLHRGASLYKLGRFAEAVAALQAAEQADELGNYSTWIHFYLARALVALDRTREARAHLRRMAELEGDVALARFRQARELLGLAVPETAPRGFAVIQDGRTTLVVRPAVAQAIRERRPASDGAPARAGRAPMQRIAIPDGVALVRTCRRGGLFGRLLGGRYLDGSRFLRELGVADALRRRGLPTPEVLAGIRREAAPAVYRAEIVTREVPGAVDLAEALRRLPPGSEEAKRALLEAAARLVRQCHDVGLRHPDLNARNVLIAPDGTAMILDLDRAELADELPPRACVAMLARLYRSLHRLGLAPQPVSDADWLAFHAAYAAGDPTLEGQAQAVLGRCHRELARHRLWWKVAGTPRNDE